MLPFKNRKRCSNLTMPSQMQYHDQDPLFPSKWNNNYLMGTDEATELTATFDRQLPSFKTKSMVGNTKWTASKLKKLIDEEGKAINERWNFPDDSRLLLMWAENTSHNSPPDALLAFSVEESEYTKTHKPSWIYLTNHLMWVNPKKRRQGYGTHLATHFITYLLDVNLRYPRVSKKGVIFVYEADYDSSGGERLSNDICNYLEDLYDTWKYEKNLATWAIKELILEVGA